MYHCLFFWIHFLFILVIPKIWACPNQESAIKCCNDYFTVYRHMYWKSCQTFEYLDKCFSLTHCDMVDLALLCSQEYRKVHNRHVPKEAMMAVYEYLRRQCTRFCTKYTKLEAACISGYKSGETIEKEEDRKLGQDIEYWKKQILSGVSWYPMADLCKNILINLKRLHAQRQGVCDSTAVYCMCRRLEKELPKTCIFKCDQFRYYGTVQSTGRERMDWRLGIGLVILVIYYLF